MCEHVGKQKDKHLQHRELNSSYHSSYIEGGCFQGNHRLMKLHTLSWQQGQRCPVLSFHQGHSPLRLLICALLLSSVCSRPEVIQRWMPAWMIRVTCIQKCFYREQCPGFIRLYLIWKTHYFQLCGKTGKMIWKVVTHSLFIHLFEAWLYLI